MSLEERVEIRLEFQAGMSRVREVGKYVYNWGDPQRLQFCWSLKEREGRELDRGHGLLKYSSYLTECLLLALTVSQAL